MFKVKIQNNTVIFSTKEAESKFNRLLSSYNNTGKSLLINIEEYSPKTTSDQMQLFKAMVIAGKEHTGMSYSEFEHELISQFAPLKYVKDIVLGTSKQRVPPTEMTRQQFKSFVEESVRFMNDFFEMDFQLQN